jgi:hypothetical protein
MRPSRLSSSLTSRREFAATLAVAALSACARRAVITPAPAPTSHADAPPPPSSPAPPPSPEADALLALLTARHGAALDGAQREQVRGGIRRVVELAERLRRVPVPNGIDPFSVCSATAGGKA